MVERHRDMSFHPTTRIARSAAALALVFGALLTVSLARPHDASACSLAGFTDPEQRVRAQVERSELIIIGTVVSEVRTGEHGARPATAEYTSTVRVEAMLKGPAVEQVELPRLGFLSASCGGGPRMAEGEHVLLFLQRSDPSWAADLGLSPIPDGVWGVALTGQGKYRLVDGEALFERSFSMQTAPEPAGPADQLIREVGRLVQAAGEPTGDSVRSALEKLASLMEEADASPPGESAPPAGERTSPATSSTAPPAIAFAALAAVVGVAALARSRIRR